MKENTKKTILIVEDEPALLKVYAEELADQGFEVLKAHNGEEGLDVALNTKPDIILLDILMPVMDGLAMMDKLRASNKWGKSVPIILLTNLSSGEDKIIASITKNEPAYYLIKSDWSLNQVVEKIKERLARKM